MLESVSYVARGNGVQLTGTAFLCAAEERPSKASPDRTYCQVLLRPQPEVGDVIYAFCERAVAEAAVAALRSAGGPIEVEVTVTVGKGGTVNLMDFAKPKPVQVAKAG